MNLEMHQSPRRAIATTDNYRDAEAIVDQLADDGFPVQQVAIVGTICNTSSRWSASSMAGGPRSVGPAPV